MPSALLGGGSPCGNIRKLCHNACQHPPPPPVLRGVVAHPAKMEDAAWPVPMLELMRVSQGPAPAARGPDDVLPSSAGLSGADGFGKKGGTPFATSAAATSFGVRLRSGSSGSTSSYVASTTK